MPEPRLPARDGSLDQLDQPRHGQAERARDELHSGEARAAAPRLKQADVGLAGLCAVRNASWDSPWASRCSRSTFPNARASSSPGTLASVRPGR